MIKYIVQYTPGCPAIFKERPDIQQESFSVREVVFRHLLRGELEMRAFTREQLVNDLALKKSGRVISMPTMSFWDAYGTFGKGTCMYISFLGGYQCPANLPLHLRLSAKSYEPHAMGPMGCDIQTVLGVLSKYYRKLEDGTHVAVMNDNGYKMYVFDLAIIGDMPQQNKNAGVVSHKGNNSCRLCHVAIGNRSDLDYNIYHNARFYHREEEQRKACLAHRTQEERKEALRSKGLTAEPSAFIQTRLALDPFQIFPVEPCHAYLNGIHGLVQDLLVTNVCCY